MNDLIVPRPRRIAFLEGGLWNFGPGTQMVGDAGGRARSDCRAFIERLFGSLPDPGPEAAPRSEGAQNTAAIRFDLDPEVAGGGEGYRLDIDRRGCRISSSGEAGLFYGVQTLKQLLFRYREGRFSNIPWLSIEDAPRFAWRGFMLDVARHFFDVGEIKRLIELAALHKFNVFHWHLTDDQGWRIEIEALPELKAVGSKRRETREDGKPEVGCYSKAEIREVVEFAAARHLTLVPEIDLPGHMGAALASYPEFSCRRARLGVATSFGVFDDTACAGRDSTLVFFETVFRELAELFPGPFVHIGGDEVPRRRWEECSDCQERIAKEGLRDEEELQAWLANRVVSFLGGLGKEAIAWNEAVYSGSLDPSVTMQYWLENRRAKRSAAAIETGRRLVYSPLSGYYLDSPYGRTSLRRTYECDPVPKWAGPSGEAGMRGIEAALWTEFVANRARMDYLLFPRLSAVAESAWTPENRRSYGSFVNRLESFAAYLSWQGADSVGFSEANPGKIGGFLQVLRHFAGAVDLRSLAWSLGGAGKPRQRPA